MVLDIRWLLNVSTFTCKRSGLCHLSSESLDIYTPSNVRGYQHLTNSTDRHTASLYILLICQQLTEFIFSKTASTLV